MAFYWGLFCLPIIWGLLPDGTPTVRRIWLSGYALFYVLVIGFRVEVGCDYYGYVRHFFIINQESFSEAVANFDLGHVIINRLAGEMGFDFFAVNVVNAIAFTVGLFAFVNRQPLPWLAMACAVPYMVTVVGMGYERQASALGMLMLAMNAFADRNVWRYLLFVFLAGLFHRTAFVFLPFAILVNGFRMSFSVIAVLVGGFALGGSVLTGAKDVYVKNYVEDSSYQSSGGLVRILVGLAATTAFAVFWKTYKTRYRDFDFLLYCAIATVISVPLVFVSSTAVDRLALYLLPFQIAVVSRLPDIFAKSASRGPIVVGILGAYAALFLVWLNYSPEAQDCWIPYSNDLF
jgi:hypothetical protein